MATFSWRSPNGGAGGAFDSALSWNNTTTGETPASSVPGSADTATLSIDGGRLTGNGSVTQLTFAAAAWVIAGDLAANNASIDYGTVSLTETTAKLTVIDALSLGRAGGAALSIANGATLAVTAGRAGPASSVGNATINVAAGGIASFGGPLSLGAGGGAATATVDAAVLAVGGVLQLGSGGAGTLIVRNGANAVLSAAADTGANAAYLRLGASAGSAGTVLVSDANSILLVASNSGSVGFAGSGALTVQNGGAARFNTSNNGLNPALSIGLLNTASGIVTVNNAGSTIVANGSLTVGGAGTGTLRILDGASVTSASVTGAQEAALSVAASAGSRGTLQISGAGAQLVASGQAVIGGDNRGSGFVTGGAGAVLLTAGGVLRTGSMRIYAGSRIDIDGASQEAISGNLTTQGVLSSFGTLSVSGTVSGSGVLQIGAGVADVGNLAAANVGFTGPSATLLVRALAGTSTISGLQYGDRIDLVGNNSVRLTGNTVTTTTGTLVLGGAPAGAQYGLASDGAGGTFVTISADTIGVFRFFDSNYGTHFFSSSTSEKDLIVGTRPDLVYEGVGLQSVDPASNDPNAAPVFRFFDSSYGTHFFTSSVDERDSVIASRPDLLYEGTGFIEHNVQQASDIAVYRFFDTRFGTHFYTADPGERATIVATRPDLIDEGTGFYAPAT